MLFRNVRVFSGTGSALSDPTRVLVSGNVIERIAADAAAEPGAPVTVIEGGGRTLMPGLIDAHLTFYDLPIAEAVNADPNYLQIRQSVGARRMLLNGFTSIRDASGPVFGLKRAIDEGLVAGPRVWPSGPMLSQTSGHSDMRSLSQLPSKVVREANPNERIG